MSEKLTNIIEQLKTLTLLEASELVTEIENVFGVDTSVSVAAAAVAPIDMVEKVLVVVMRKMNLILR